MYNLFRVLKRALVDPIVWSYNFMVQTSANNVCLVKTVSTGLYKTLMKLSVGIDENLHVADLYRSKLPPPRPF